MFLTDDSPMGEESETDHNELTLSDFVEVDHRRRTALTGLRPPEARFVLLSGGVLGLVAAICIMASVAILSDDLVSSVQMPAVSVLSAIGWWCVFRFPGKPVVLPNPRPILRSHLGTHFPSYLLKSDWDTTDQFGLALGGSAHFATRRKPALWSLSAYTVATTVSYFGTRFTSGDLSTVAFISYVLFGACAAGVICSSAKLLLRKRSIFVDAHRITLRYPVGYLPNVSLQQKDLLAGIVRNGELILISRPQRVDVIDLNRLEHPRGFLAARGLDPSDQDLTGAYDEEFDEEH